MNEQYVKLSDVKDLLRLIELRDMYREGTTAHRIYNDRVKEAKELLLSHALTKEEL